MAGTTKKVRFISAWQTYRVGDIIEPSGLDRAWLLANGYVVDAEAETPARPAKLTTRAAKKIAEGAKGLFGKS